MPGTTNMGVGALWAIGGTFVTAITYSATSGGGTYVIAYGAIIYGGLQFVIGLFQYLNYQSRGEEGKLEIHTEEGKLEIHTEGSLRATLTAMITMAAADGKIEDSEIDVIANIFERVFEGTLEKDSIRDTAEEILENDLDIYDAIGSETSVIDPDMVLLIFVASYQVAAADGAVDKNEINVLIQIGKALGMNDADIKDGLSELQKTESA